MFTTRGIDVTLSKRRQKTRRQSSDMENKRADSGKALSISECRKINLAMKGTEQQEDQDGMSVSISMKQHKKEDTKFSNFCQCIKASIGCVFIVLVVFGLLAYVIVNETEKRGM